MRFLDVVGKEDHQKACWCVLGCLCWGSPHTLGATCSCLSPTCVGSNASHGRRQHLLSPLAGLPGQAGIRIFSLASSSWDMAANPVRQAGEVQLPKWEHPDLQTTQGCYNSVGHGIEGCLQRMQDAWEKSSAVP